MAGNEIDFVLQEVKLAMDRVKYLHDWLINLKPESK